MKILWKFIAVLVALTAVGVAPPPNSQDRTLLPQLFYSRVKDRQAPIWVAAELARTADQKVDFSSFSNEEREALRRKLATQDRLRGEERPRSLSNAQKAGHEAVRDENCIVYESAFFHLAGGPREAGFQGLTKSAGAIYLASVTEVAQGFFLGSPASLLHLEIRDTLKSDGEGRPIGELIAVYPFARFSIGDHVFCSGPPGSATPPRFGQGVLAFVASDTLDRDHSLIYLSPDQLITKEIDGRLSLPRALRDDRELFPASPGRL